MNFLRDEWRLILHLALAFIVLPLGLWRITIWLGWTSVLPLSLIFAGPVLWLAFCALHFALEYLMCGYFIYQDHGENVVYKERGKGKLNFYITPQRVGSVHGGVDIHVASERSWKSVMPSWAGQHRQIILQRLEKELRGTDEVHFVTDGS